MLAYAGDNLIGAIVAGNLPRPDRSQFRRFVLALLVSVGLALAIFGWIRMTWLAFTVMLLLAIGNGYFVITTITLLQSITPKEMPGRLMSLLLFASIGLLPLSQVLLGALSRWSLTSLFVGAGVLILFLALWTILQKAFMQVDVSPGES